MIRHVVGKDYFDTTGILPTGRAFRQEDETGQTAAVIVSQEFARQFWPGADPLGRRIEIGNDEIVAAKACPVPSIIASEQRPAGVSSSRW